MSPCKAYMKVARGLHELEPTTSLTLGCKRLRPLTSAAVAAEFDLKSESSYHPNKESTEVEGGRRWIPTQEQLGILEMLYGGGMRAPNGRQIEQITTELRNHGEIEGKNVFYWFQNHKARERQRQRRISLGLRYGRRKTSSPFTAAAATAFPVNRCGEGEGEDRTLKLFPLQPERRIND